MRAVVLQVSRRGSCRINFNSRVAQFGRMRAAVNRKVAGSSPAPGANFADVGGRNPLH